MEPLLTPEELDRLETTPLEERARVLEEIEQRLRAALDDASPA